MGDKAPLIQTFTVPVLAAAANADSDTAVVSAPFAGVVTAVKYIARTKITGANTDSRTLQCYNRKLDGTGTTKVAEKAFTAGVDANAMDETAITLTTTAADLVVAEGDVLSFKSLHVGTTGLADPGGTAEITIERS